MANEWLKLEASTPDKPEVFAITTAMGWDDPDLTVGKLFRVWRWFDQHTINGNAPGVTPALLDRIAGVTGFAQCMANERWLVISDAGISLPNFEKHNGATAKSRAQTAKRVANHRADAPCNADGNAATVTPALAREEKRRKEKTTPKTPASPAFDPVAELKARGVSEQVALDWMKIRKAKRVPLTLTGLNDIIAAADSTNMPLSRAVTICCRRGWAGFEVRWLTDEDRATSAQTEKIW
ncbi:MAG: hypothetical protein V4633_13410 [Pseudomonadota bacterium]